MTYEPRPEHRFSFGLWTVGNIGIDPFGEPVREVLSPVQLVELLAEVGAWGVNLHDNDLPIDTSAHERDQIVSDFRKALDATGLIVPMATTNLFRDPVFRDGAFTANDPRVRAYALQKTMRAIDLGVELGATTYVFWGGREGVETDFLEGPVARPAAIPGVDGLPVRLREGPGLRPPLRAGIQTERTARRHLPLHHRRDARVHRDARALGDGGVNPEVAHEHMAGLNFTHHVAQAWAMGKLFHIDLNDQIPGRYDQDLRFGSANPKAAFFLVKLRGRGLRGQPSLRRSCLPDVRLRGREGVRARVHAHLPDPEEKAERWNVDPEIQALVAQINADDGTVTPHLGPHTPERAEGLKARHRPSGGRRTWAALRAARSADGRPPARSSVTPGSEVVHVARHDPPEGSS